MSVVSFLSRLATVGLLAVAMVYLAGCSSADDRAVAHFKRGSEFAAQGDPVKASLEYRNALKLKSVYPDAQFALGQAQEQQGSYSDALRSYLAVAEQVPTHVQARVRLSFILLAGGQLDEAAKYADQAAALAADDPTVLVAQAAIAIKRGDGAKGAELAEAALAKDPESIDALMVLASGRMLASDPAGALAFIERAPASGANNLGLQVLKLTALDAMNDQPAVEELFGELVAMFPDTPVFRESLIRWYLDKERPDDAERVIREDAMQKPLDDQAQLTLIAFLTSYRSPDIAMTELEKVIADRAAASGDTYALRLALAQVQLGAGQGADAIKLLQSVVAETTDAQKRNQARVQLARILANSGDATQAETTVDAVLTEDPKNVDALSVRASLRLLKGATTEAIPDLLSALNEAPDNSGLHGLLAEAYERDGSLVLAEEQYSKALDLSQADPQTGLPVARFFIKYGKLDQAVRALDAVRRRAPANREVLGLLAQVKLSTQDWIGAQQVADTLRQLGEDRDTSTADRIGAAVLMGLNRYSDSIDLLQQAIAGGDSSQQDVLPDLVTAYMRSGKEDVARQYLDDILLKDPENTQALILLGSIEFRGGQNDLAEQNFSKAAEGTGLEGEVALAQFYISTDNAKAAEATIFSALEQDSGNTVLQLLLAALYERTERFDDAIAVYDKLYGQDPTATNVANDLASLMSERRTDAASLDRAFEIAQRLRGSDVPQYLDTLGWIHYLRGEYDAALPLLRSAASRLANVALVHYHLGMAYNALGQAELARTSLERALATTPPMLEADIENAKAALRALGEEDVTAGAAQKG